MRHIHLFLFSFHRLVARDEVHPSVLEDVLQASAVFLRPSPSSVIIANNEIESIWFSAE